MPAKSENLRGILYMTFSMACFTLGDAFVKLASEQLPSGQVMMTLGLGCASVFLVMMKLKKQAIVFKPFFERPVVLRNCGEVIVAICMFAALALIPFSLVTAIIQTAPLVMTVAAALFLGEKVGIHRFSAVLVGFIGVMIVIRPGLAGFDKYSLLALVAVFGMSMRDIGARLAPPSISTLLLSFYSVLTIAGTGLVLLLIFGGLKVPNFTVTLYLIGLVAATSMGFIAITQSVRIAEISVVSPFRYTRLLFGLAFSILILGEVADYYTIVGSLITILAGIYIWLRERNLAQKTE